MWPSGGTLGSVPQAAWESDLGLSELVKGLTIEARYTAFIRKALAALTADPAVIEWRQSALKDFIQNPPLADRLEAVLPRLADLRQGHALLGKRTRGLLLETADRLAQLDLYLEVIREMHDALQAATLSSEALRGLRASLNSAIQNEGFQALIEELPALQAPMQNLASLTVGINLNADLQPVAAVLLSINAQPFGEAASLLERLLGVRTEPNGEVGIAPLHNVPSDREQRPLSPLFQDLDRLSVQIAQPVARALARYVQQSIGSLAQLEDELAFYVGGARLMQRLIERHIPICFPEVARADERLTHIEGLLNISLAVRPNAQPVPSDVEFDADARIAILTGPNSGGKTTYLQAVGLAHVLFQAGLFIPAQAARISPLDTILTHFPALETRQQGRLAEEAERLREIFVRATASSLVLLNESLSSTTPGEALYLAQDVLSGLRSIGVRALFATHLLELTARMAEIEAAAAGDSKLISLVAGVQFTVDGHALPTFRIAPGVPLGSGYAQEIAQRYGISLAQILKARRAQTNFEDLE